MAAPDTQHPPLRQTLSSWSIRHPVPTVLLFVVLTLAGLVA